MAFDGSINIDSSIDGSGFTKGVEKMASAAKTALGAMTGIIGGAAAALGGAAVAGVKYNSEMEQYVTSFGTMLGGANKATSMVANLKKFAADTPFEFNDLAKGTQTLLAFGTSAKDVLPDLQMLGDVSQGNTERFDALTLAFAQVGSAGKMQGQDLLQFVNAGFNPLNEMARTTGKSMADLRTEMENGQISAQDVANAFKSATSKGGQFYQAMEAQSKTFNGQLSTLKDNAMQFLGQLTAGLQNSLKDTALPMVNGWMDELQSAFASGGVNGVVKAFGNVLSEAVSAIASQAPQVINLAVLLIQSFVDGIASNAPELANSAVQIVGALASGIVKLLPTLGNAALQLVLAIGNELLNDGPQISKGATGLINNLINGLVAGLPQIINMAVQLITALAQGLADHAPQIISGVQQIITVLISALLQAAPQLAQAALQLMSGFFSALMQQNPPAGIFLGIVGAVKGLQGTFAGLDKAASTATSFKNMGGLAGAISKQFKDAKGNIGVLKDAFADLGGTFKTAGGGIASFAKLIGGGALTGIKTLAGGIATVAKGAAGLAGGLLQAAGGFIKMGAEAAASAVKLLIQRGAALAVAAAEKIQAAVQWLLNAAMDANPIGIIIVVIAALVAAVILLWTHCSAFRNFLIGAWNVIKAAAIAVGNGVKAAFIGAWNGIKAAWSAVSGFFHGVWNGIVGIFSGISNWFRDRFNDAKNAILSIFKPNMLTDIGGNLLKGLWNGITNVTGWLLDKIKGLGSTIVNGFKSVFGIHSPSRLMRDEIGKMLPPGIAVGFKASMPDAVSDMQAQMEGLTAKMQASVTAQQARAFSGIHSVQTIDNSVTTTKNPTIQILGPVNVTDQGNQRQTLQQLQFLAGV